MAFGFGRMIGLRCCLKIFFFAIYEKPDWRTGVLFCIQLIGQSCRKNLPMLLHTIPVFVKNMTYECGRKNYENLLRVHSADRIRRSRMVHCHSAGAIP